MAEFYLDHNVTVEGARHLRDAGHGARTAADVGLEQARDHRQLLQAALRGWILVTSDWKDFRLLHDAWQEWPRACDITPLPPHAGVLVIPGAGTRPGRWTASVAAEQLVAFMDGAPPLANALYRWFLRDGWVAF